MRPGRIPTPTRAGIPVGALERWLGPVAIAVAAVAMIRWNWMGWPDPSFDFGRELYIPWQMSESRLLYRDLAYHSGPFSPHLNLLWFKLFGVSLRTLVFCNLAIAGGVIALLYRMVREVASRLAATMTGLTFVTLFGFSQFVASGNFNWITPYSHEMTHGVGLSLLSLWLLHRARRRGSAALAACSGLAMGLVFLTKGEVFLAAAAAGALGLGLSWFAAGTERGAAARLALAWCGAILVAPLLALGLACAAMPPEEALSGVLGTWRYVFLKENAYQVYFLKGSGLHDPAGQLGKLAIWLGWYSAAFLPALAGALVCRRPGRRRVAVAAGLFVAGVPALLAIRHSVDWRNIALPLPFVVAAIAAGALFRFLRARDRARDEPFLELIATTFAGLLLLKMILSARIFHYGFGLAMPATLILVVFLVDKVPEAIRRRGGFAPVFLAAFGAVWVMTVTGHLDLMRNHLQKKQHVVGEGADAFVADILGAMVEDARRAVVAYSAPGRTLACLPDCEMLNYLARRANPTRYSNFVPHEVMIHGEEKMLDAFRARPPDLVALVHRNTSEYGSHYFGRDYATELNGWIRRNYRVIVQLGAVPLRDRNRGVLILTRNSRNPS